ncbi:DUF5610 domain-containing protein [Shewanella algidipiscicola]|uniref:DUF5610 domain-containing protein n=1 Tax=Shewanella algidipiscicola TaxID=614070 RepID=A0ABQ4PJM3_9GAMM|nr:DUF5610 domain-containing protein [Shewanella algidipiscicola]GIU47755.1 hypothetical protein TUM4630_22500 [Shewanella algidipiscicola]
MQINNHGTAVSETARNKSETNTNHGQQVADVANTNTAQATSKQLMNTAILSAQQAVNLSSANEPMRLLYKAAIASINEHLAPSMGQHAIETAVEQGVDTSAEATAERIVSFATQFFSVHQEQNSNMTFDEQLSSFMEIIGGAIDQGFDEAKDILSGLKVLEGDIADGVEQTYSLVQQGLQAFRDSFNPEVESI